MRNTRLLWVAFVILAAGIALYGCSMLKKGKPAETPISVTEQPATATPTEAPPGTAAPTEAPASPYAPKTLDVLRMLDDCLGASQVTLGWDNMYCSVSLDKDVELFTMLQSVYDAGTADRNFVEASIKDLGNIKTNIDEKVAKGEGIDPTSTDAKDKKAKIAAIRAKVRGMISGPAPKKEPIPKWKGDMMKRKWNELGEMMKKKWAERGKK